LATAAAPVVPPAPPRLSMVMLCPRAWLSGSRMIRAMASVEPPGGKLTIGVIERLG